MDNKEKAIHLAENNLDICFGSKRDYGVTCALEMAQWKDEQFKEQKKLTWKEVKLIIELDGNIETDNFMGFDEYYQAIADKANVVLFGLQGKLD